MIRKYTEEDFIWLEKWITDEDLLTQFAGSAWSFPLTVEQIRDFYTTYPQRWLYMGYRSDNSPAPFAIGEIINEGADIPRLGRLLVGDPEARGKGAGTIFIQELIDECKKNIDAAYLYLFVADDNVPAIRCYEKLGFVMMEKVDHHLVYGGRPHQICKMGLKMK